jgi:hypothetical protein
LKKIRDYLYKNGIYIQKEVRKLIADSLLGTIYKLTPLKWPADNPANNPANNPTDNPTLALLLLSTAPF